MLVCGVTQVFSVCQFVQAVAVVGPVADQAIGGSLEKPVVDRLLHESDLMG